MSQEEFRTQYEYASALVETWPAWKQKMLEIYSSPTVAVPRAPVDNVRVDDLRTLAECENKGAAAPEAGA